MMKKIYLAFFIIGFFLSPLFLLAQKEKSVDELLLKDYHPVSIYNIPESKIEKAKFPVIDLHSHPYAKSQTDLQNWIETQKAAGIKKTIVLTYAHGEKFDSLASIYKPYSDHFELWCGFDYTGYDELGFAEKAVAELERCYKMGARGVGELGDKGKGLFYSEPEAWGMHADDPRMDALFEKCAELSMPVSIHVADPKWMYEKMDASNDGLMNAYKWRLDDQQDIVDHAGMISILENTVKKHPNTTFVACHFANCAYDLQIIGNLLDKYPNLYLDISARYAEVSAIPRNTKKFFEKYQDRLVYGTDMGTSANMYEYTFRILESEDEHIYSNYNPYHWPLHGLDLSDEVLEKVYHLNAEKFLR